MMLEGPPLPSDGGRQQGDGLSSSCGRVNQCDPTVLAGLHDPVGNLHLRRHWRNRKTSSTTCRSRRSKHLPVSIGHGRPSSHFPSDGFDDVPIGMPISNDNLPRRSLSFSTTDRPLSVTPAATPTAPPLPLSGDPMEHQIVRRRSAGVVVGVRILFPCISATASSGRTWILLS